MAAVVLPTQRKRLLENYADLASLLFSELQTFGGVQRPAAHYPLVELGTDSPSADFLALLAAAPAQPVLPAHAPLQRQSLPQTGQPLPVSLPVGDPVHPRVPSAVVTPTIAPSSTDPVAAPPEASARPVRPEQSGLPNRAESVKEPVIDVHRVRAEPANRLPIQPAAIPSLASPAGAPPPAREPGVTKPHATVRPLRTAGESVLALDRQGLPASLRETGTIQAEKALPPRPLLEAVDPPEPGRIERAPQAATSVSLAAPATGGVGQPPRATHIEQSNPRHPDRQRNSRCGCRVRAAPSVPTGRGNQVASESSGARSFGSQGCRE